MVALCVAGIVLISEQTSRLVPPVDGHDTSGEVDPKAHGFGPVGVSINTLFSTGVTRRVVEAAKRLGGRFKFTEDLEDGKFVGFSSSSYHSAIPRKR